MKRKTTKRAERRAAERSLEGLGRSTMGIEYAGGGDDAGRGRGSLMVLDIYGSRHADQSVLVAPQLELVPNNLTISPRAIPDPSSSHPSPHYKDIADHITLHQTTRSPP